MLVVSGEGKDNRQQRSRQIYLSANSSRNSSSWAASTTNKNFAFSIFNASNIVCARQIQRHQHRSVGRKEMRNVGKSQSIGRKGVRNVVGGRDRGKPGVGGNNLIFIGFGGAGVGLTRCENYSSVVWEGIRMVGVAPVRAAKAAAVSAAKFLQNNKANLGRWWRGSGAIFTAAITTHTNSIQGENRLRVGRASDVNDGGGVGVNEFGRFYGSSCGMDAKNNLGFNFKGRLFSSLIRRCYLKEVCNDGLKVNEYWGILQPARHISMQWGMHADLLDLKMIDRQTNKNKNCSSTCYTNDTNNKSSINDNIYSKGNTLNDGCSTYKNKGNNGLRRNIYDSKSFLKVFNQKNSCRSFSSATNNRSCPYAVLGIPRGSSLAEIKKGFRDKAKLYHPDLNPSPDAKKKMSELTSAYELLSDPQKKEFYDRTGMTTEEAQATGAGGFDPSIIFSDFADFFASVGSQGFGMGGTATAARGEDLQTEVTLDFMEAVKGSEKTIRFNAKCSCSNCNGSGSSSGSTGVRKCGSCGGSGVQRVERGPIVLGVPCRVCGGGGQVITNPCRTCKATGVRMQQRQLSIQIPQGVRQGMQMRVPSQGHAGQRGGKLGHLFVTINIRPHPTFRWIEDNIHVDVPLSIKQCLLGGRITVETLEGPVELFVSPNTNPNSKKVLAQKGPPKMQTRGRGDLIIDFHLGMPAYLTPQQVQLIEQFDQIEKSRAEQSDGHKKEIRNVGNDGGTRKKSHSSGSSISPPPPPPPPPPLGGKKL